jgi:hypothetical protein
MYQFSHQDKQFVRDSADRLDAEERRRQRIFAAVGALLGVLAFVHGALFVVWCSFKSLDAGMWVGMWLWWVISYLTRGLVLVLPAVLGACAGRTIARKGIAAAGWFLGGWLLYWVTFVVLFWWGIPREAV